MLETVWCKCFVTFASSVIAISFFDTVWDGQWRRRTFLWFTSCSWLKETTKYACLLCSVWIYFKKKRRFIFSGFLLRNNITVDYIPLTVHVTEQKLFMVLKMSQQEYKYRALLVLGNKEWKVIKLTSQRVVIFMFYE